MENLAKALVAVQKVITNAPKNAINPFFKSKYTDLATAVNHCRPVLAEHGLAIIQLLDNLDGKPAIRTALIHESGENKAGIMPMDLPSDPQKAGSYITYMRRYSYLAMVGIAPEDDDANAAASKTVPPKQPSPSSDTPKVKAKKRLEALIGKTDNVTREQIKAATGKASMNDFTQFEMEAMTKNWDKTTAKIVAWQKAQDQAETLMKEEDEDQDWIGPTPSPCPREGGPVAKTRCKDCAELKDCPGWEPNESAGSGSSDIPF